MARAGRKLNGDMPRAVARRIMRRTAESDEPIVVTSRDGRPSRVFGFSEYRKMTDLPHHVRPWEYRKDKKVPPDPLGAVDAEPPLPLTRKSMYEEE